MVHYTSLANVIAMLKPDLDGERYLRMYNAIGFNDPGEGSYFTNLAKANSNLLTAYLLGDDVDANPAYIASFIRVDPPDTEMPHTIDSADHLMFWRAYGREGAGCSLTLFFDAKEDEVHNVIYGEGNTVESVKSIAGRLQPLINDAAAVFHAAVAVVGHALSEDELANELKSQVSVRLKRLSYLYKSDPFRYENECRFVVTSDTAAERGMTIRFDYSGPAGQEVVKKYVEHPSLKLTGDNFRTGSVITLGPLVPNPQHAKEYLEQLLKEARFHGPQVRLSDIDYRRPFYH